jgi:prevent-host-death family protein
MTKRGRTRSIAAGQFKAGCLALLDEVASTGETLIVTKRGRPVAQITPVAAPKGLAGSITREGDLISPLGDTWESEG